MGREELKKWVDFDKASGRGLVLSILLGAVACQGLACCQHLKRLGDERVESSTRVLPNGYVDRIEGEYAVLITEDENVIDWPASGLREGDVVRDGRPDPEATAALKARVGALRSRLSKEEQPWDELDL